MMRQFRLLCPFSLCPLWLKFSSSLKISPLRVASVGMTTFLLEPVNDSKTTINLILNILK